MGRGSARRNEHCQRLTGCTPPALSLGWRELDDGLLRLAKLVDAERDDVAGLQEHRVRLFAHAHARWRAGGDDVARLQRHQRRAVRHDGGDIEDHGLGVAGLLAHTIDVEPHAELLRVADLVGGDQPRADRTEGVEALALVPGHAALNLPFAFGDVIHQAIADHVVFSAGPAQIAAKQDRADQEQVQGDRDDQPADQPRAPVQHRPEQHERERDRTGEPRARLERRDDRDGHRLRAALEVAGEDERGLHALCGELARAVGMQHDDADRTHGRGRRDDDLACRTGDIPNIARTISGASSHPFP